jgi:hypothetical protein
MEGYNIWNFILLDALGMYKRKTEISLTFTAEVMENINQHLEGGKASDKSPKVRKYPNQP